MPGDFVTWLTLMAAVRLRFGESIGRPPARCLRTRPHCDSIRPTASRAVTTAVRADAAPATQCHGIAGLAHEQALVFVHAGKKYGHRQATRTSGRLRGIAVRAALARMPPALDGASPAWFVHAPGERPRRRVGRRATSASVGGFSYDFVFGAAIRRSVARPVYPTRRRRRGPADATAARPGRPISISRIDTL